MPLADKSLKERLHLRARADYALIAIGSIMVAAAADMFLIPNRVVSGGLTGVSTVLYYVIGTPVGLVTFLLNVPLFLANIRWGGGWRAGVKTVFAVAVMSAAIDLLQPYLPQATADPVLYTVYGGLLDGLGLGLVFRAGGTTGGTDIIARLAHRFLGIKLGHTCWRPTSSSSVRPPSSSASSRPCTPCCWPSCPAASSTWCRRGSRSRAPP